MYSETKKAVEKAFEIGRILFALGPKQYAKLIKATYRIKPPLSKEIEKRASKGATYEDAMIAILTERYKSAAIEAGFTEKHGVAVLEYAALLEEIK